MEVAIQSLSSIIPSLPPLSSSTNPALALFHDHSASSQIVNLLRQPNSGSGDNNLCRWFYDTFQSNVPELQLLVLRFIPTIAGVYLSRIANRKPQAGFEAVLLALYAHETNSRAGQAITVTIPDMSHPSIYHESKATTVKNNATELNIAVISPSLEPHGTVRSTRRARIVGVALELYYTKITQMPVSSKIEFCEFSKLWAGQDGDMYRDADDGKVEQGGKLMTEEEKKLKKKEGRIPLPWDLLQPVLRVLGHCLMGVNNDMDKKLIVAASEACRCLHARSMHDINPKAILATGSLLSLSKSIEKGDLLDPTEIPRTNIIQL
ncbi:hypothetical protein L6164_029161 [Bauhinia variegata]|uniref:Uncharacterized protein n=1 Tax=Bauhinia variegata TaxID=167791 RepID=A0ACB9L9P4_BAUVA|nr:hypothetical protein L6164_029161 [Bauhinia variegata]